MRDAKNSGIGHKRTDSVRERFILELYRKTYSPSVFAVSCVMFWWRFSSESRVEL
jgi:hypothetical protein